MRLAPGGDVVVVVAVRHGAADHQQQHLRERVGDPPHVARVLDGGEMLQQHAEAGLLRGWAGGGQGHGGGSEADHPSESTKTQPVTPFRNEFGALPVEQALLKEEY